MISFHQTSSISFPVQFHNEKHNVTFITFRDDFHEFAFKLSIERERVVTSTQTQRQEESDREEDFEGEEIEASSIDLSSRSTSRTDSVSQLGDYPQHRQNQFKDVDKTLTKNTLSKRLESSNIGSNSSNINNNINANNNKNLDSKILEKNHDNQEQKVITHKHLKDEFSLFITNSDFERLYKFSESLKLKTLYIWLRDALLQKTDQREVSLLLYTSDLDQISKEITKKSIKSPPRSKKDTSQTLEDKKLNQTNLNSLNKKISLNDRLSMKNNELFNASKRISPQKNDLYSTQKSNRSKTSIPGFRSTLSRTRSPLGVYPIYNEHPINLEALDPDTIDIDTPRDLNFGDDHLTAQTLKKSIINAPSLSHIKKTLIPNSLVESHSLTTFYCPKIEKKLIKPVAIRLNRKVRARNYCQNDDDIMVLRLIHSKMSNFSKMRSLWFVMNHKVIVEKIEVESVDDSSVSSESTLPPVVIIPPTPIPIKLEAPINKSKYSKMVYIGESEYEFDIEARGENKNIYGDPNSTIMSHFVNDENVYSLFIENREKERKKSESPSIESSRFLPSISSSQINSSRSLKPNFQEGKNDSIQSGSNQLLNTGNDPYLKMDSSRSIKLNNLSTKFNDNVQNLDLNSRNLTQNNISNLQSSRIQPQNLSSTKIDHKRNLQNESTYLWNIKNSNQISSNFALDSNRWIDNAQVNRISLQGTISPNHLSRSNSPNKTISPKKKRVTDSRIQLLPSERVLAKRLHHNTDQFGLKQRGEYAFMNAYQSKLTSDSEWMIPSDSSIKIKYNDIPGLTQILCEARTTYSTAVSDFRLKDDFCCSWCIRLDQLCRKKEIYIGICPEISKVPESYCIALDHNEFCFSISCKDSQIYTRGAPRGKISDDVSISQGDSITFLFDGIEGKLYYYINGGKKRFAMRLKNASIIRPSISFGKERYSISIIPPPPIETLQK